MFVSTEPNNPIGYSEAAEEPNPRASLAQKLNSNLNY